MMKNRCVVFLKPMNAHLLNRILLIALAPLLLCSPLQAQGATKRPTPVSFSIFGGVVSTPSPLMLSFNEDARVGIFRTGWFGGAGITLGPYRMQSDIDWSLEIDGSIHSVQSFDFILNRQSLSYKNLYVPFLMIFRVQSHAKLTPFIRAGAGAAYNRVSLRWSNTPEEVNDYAAFSWMIGAGISSRFALSYSIEIFFDLLSIEGSEFMEYKNGFSIIVHDRFFLLPVGINLRYHL